MNWWRIPYLDNAIISLLGWEGRRYHYYINSRRSVVRTIRTNSSFWPNSEQAEQTARTPNSPNIKNFKTGQTVWTPTVNSDYQSLTTNGAMVSTQKSPKIKRKKTDSTVWYHPVSSLDFHSETPARSGARNPNLAQGGWGALNFYVKMKNPVLIFTSV